VASLKYIDDGSSASPSASFVSVNAVSTSLTSARSRLLTVSTKRNHDYSQNVKISLVVASVTPKVYHSVTPNVSHNGTSSMQMSSEIGFEKNKLLLCPSKVVMDRIDDWAKQQLLDSSGGLLASLRKFDLLYKLVCK